MQEKNAQARLCFCRGWKGYPPLTPGLSPNQEGVYLSRTQEAEPLMTAVLKLSTGRHQTTTTCAHPPRSHKTGQNPQELLGTLPWVPFMTQNGSDIRCSCPSLLPFFPIHLLKEREASKYFANHRLGHCDPKSCLSNCQVALRSLIFQLLSTCMHIPETEPWALETVGKTLPMNHGPQHSVIIKSN